VGDPNTDFCVNDIAAMLQAPQQRGVLPCSSKPINTRISGAYSRNCLGRVSGAAPWGLPPSPRLGIAGTTRAYTTFKPNGRNHNAKAPAHKGGEGRGEFLFNK